MSKRVTDSGSSVNIHAPWRDDYIKMLNHPVKGCFLCHARDDTRHEAEDLILWRTRHCVVVMNRFPYTGGHLLIAPRRHVDSLAKMSEPAMLDMLRLARDCQKIIANVLHAEGFNVGINVGRCAGAGLPGHIHMHVVPRWGGDTNFMSVLGGVRVIPQSVAEIRRNLLAEAKRLHLPKK
jgi:ATP adenylyltransferase